ncbi:MAG: hypothetical protein ABJA71_08245 [Ginsengibacter sp.]
MPFDKLDKKVQEAAAQHNPAYNDEAWSKMEALLNEHMPQQKDERRKFPTMWLFILLCIIAGSSLIILIKPWNNNGKTIVPAKSNTITLPAAHSISTSGIIKTGKTTNKIQPGRSSTNKIPDQIFVSSLSNQNDIETRTKNKLYAGTELISSQSANTKNNEYKDQASQSFTKISDPIGLQHQNFSSEFIHQITIGAINENKNSITINLPIINFIKENKTRFAETKKQSREKKTKLNNSFSLNFSAGPDVSAVSINNIGTFNVLFGAGFSYSFAKKWLLRTGLYSVKKVYEAKPSDYHPPSFFWNLYPQLENINADCRVNEVPLILSYKFSQSLKREWFGAVGISSYFMKKETYNYSSKNSWGQYQTRSYTINKQNKHYFSSLRLSAGYERKVNNIISLSAEPYLNLPLSGVGFGKVKLNSSGLMFTLSLKPFAKR